MGKLLPRLKGAILSSSFEFVFFFFCSGHGLSHLGAGEGFLFGQQLCSVLHLDRPRVQVPTLRWALLVQEGSNLWPLFPAGAQPAQGAPCPVREGSAAWLLGVLLRAGQRDAWCYFHARGARSHVKYAAWIP